MRLLFCCFFSGNACVALIGMICVLAVRMCYFPSLFPKGTGLGEMDLAPGKTTPRLQ